jgi:signal peptidase
VVAFIMIAVRFHWEFDAVLSGSMEPKLGVGGLVVIKPADARQVQVGDVVSFKLPGIDTPICHRIIDIQETADGRMFQTKGDANEEPDINLVPAAAITGREIFYVPYAGNLARLSELGRQRVGVAGMRLPLAVIIIAGIGLLFIGLTLKDALEEAFHPERKKQKERLKKRRETFMKKRKSFP